MSKRDKPVPTFGTADNYMALLWRMDAMYSGQRIKPVPVRSKRERVMNRLFCKYCQDITAAQDKDDSGLSNYFDTDS